MILNRLGKKTKIAQKIQQYFPTHVTYVEPFFGAGGMYFNKPKARYNVLNDNDSKVFHLYQTLKKSPKKLVDGFLDMPKHQDLLKYCKEKKPQDPIEKTNCFLMGSNMTFLGKGSTLRYGNTNERKNFQQKAQTTYDYLKDAQFMNKDFRKVIDSIAGRDKEKTFIYADPPYVNTDSNYEDKSWKTRDLNDLMAKLKNSNVRFAISEFDSPDVLRLARKHKLKVIKIGERRNLNNRRTEVLVVNYDAKKQFKENSKSRLVKKLRFKSFQKRSKKKGINVLSTFDGISVAQLALKKAKIKVNKYYASEIDPKAIEVTQRNFKDTIQLGDITKVKAKNLEDIDLLIGGSPCQGFSIAGKKLNFRDPRSKLFFEFVRLKKQKKPKYFLFENVKMNKKSEDIISKALGVKPIIINSSKVSGQNRERLYWTNIPNIKQIKDKQIYFHDAVDGPTNCKQDKFSYRDYDFEFDPDKTSLAGTKNIGNYSDNNRRQHARIFSTCKSKSPTVLAGSDEIKILGKNGKVRKLKPVEIERLQNLPDGYTAGLSDSKRQSLIGNGFTANVITHLVDPIKQEKLNTKIKKNISPAKKKKIKKYKKVALMQKAKKRSTGKIIRNVAIGGLAVFLLSKALRTKKNAGGSASDDGAAPNPSFGSFFYPPVEFMALRSDSLGDGSYGSSRDKGNRTHNGIDLITYGPDIFCPMDGVMIRLANPYPDDPRFNGMLIKGAGLYQGLEMKIFYMNPFLAPGEYAFAGQIIGSAQKISNKWGAKMLDHIHVQVTENGRFIDPTPLFFNTI